MDTDNTGGFQNEIVHIVRSIPFIQPSELTVLTLFLSCWKMQLIKASIQMTHDWQSTQSMKNHSSNVQWKHDVKEALEDKGLTVIIPP